MRGVYCRYWTTLTLLTIRAIFYHSQATIEISQLNAEDVVVIVPYSVFLETHSLILKRLGIKVGLRFIGEISSGAELFHPQSFDYLQAVKILQKFSDQSITMFDATTAIMS